MTTRVDLGARRNADGMFIAGYSMTTTVYTAVTEGKRRYSYEKEPVLLDKQFTNQLLGTYV